MDPFLLNLFGDLPPHTLAYAVLLAVVISPLIYRWRSRMRRITVRLAWIAVGVGIGIAL